MQPCEQFVWYGETYTRALSCYLLSSEKRFAAIDSKNNIISFVANEEKVLIPSRVTKPNLVRCGDLKPGDIFRRTPDNGDAICIRCKISGRWGCAWIDTIRINETKFGSQWSADCGVLADEMVELLDAELILEVQQ